MKKHHYVALGLYLVSCAALARDPFVTTATVDANAPVTQGFTRLADLIGFYTDANLAQIAPTYTPNSMVSTVVDLRGMTGVSLAYPANSTTLQLRIPSLGISQDFTGATRSDSQDLLKQWFKGQGTQALTQLLRGLVAQSPIDPVAGNPNSLMSQMAQGSFDSAINAGLGAAGAQGGVAVGGTDSPKNFIGVAARFGQYTQRDFNASVASLPLTYTHLFDGGDGYALVMDLPLTYISNNGAKSGSAMLGVGLRIPVSARWSLTPDLRAGLTGSADLGAASLIYSGGATSLYRFDPIGGFGFGLANMVSYYKTKSIKVGDYDIAYDLANTVFRNGLLLGRDAGFEWLGAPMWWEAQLVRTDYRGDRLYSSFTNDFSLSLGTRREAGRVVWNALRIGLTYTAGGGDIHGVQANLGYTF